MLLRQRKLDLLHQAMRLPKNKNEPAILEKLEQANQMDKVLKIAEDISFWSATTDQTTAKQTNL